MYAHLKYDLALKAAEMKRMQNDKVWTPLFLRVYWFVFNWV